MTAKLAVTVSVDMDAAAVTLRPSGILTTENVQGLLAVVQRAGRVLPGCDVYLDLDQLRAGSLKALDTLSQSGAKTLTRPQPRHARPVHRRHPAAKAAA